MSDKKKKSKKKAGGSAKSSAMTGEIGDNQKIEYLQAQVLDLTEKQNRFKLKCEIMTKENDLLGKAQTKFSNDKQDIVEFLNIKVGEHEKLITTLELKAKKLDEDLKHSEHKSALELENTKLSSGAEIESLTIQCNKFKAELLELTAFSARKAELEKTLILYEEQLKKNEIDHRTHIHNLERKMLQDKNQLKKDMIHRVNEAVANFRRIADQQMAETTKRALRENVAITSQLKKMSTKTIEIIHENKCLSQKVEKLSNINSLLCQSEVELSKRNQSNQGVIKMLVGKLRESDKMLEFAIDTIPSPDVGENFGQVSSVYVEQLNHEIDELRDQNDDMNSRLIEIAEISAAINFKIQDDFTETSTKEDQQDTCGELNAMIHKIGTLTGYDIDTRNEEPNEGISLSLEQSRSIIEEEQSIAEQSIQNLQNDDYVMQLEDSNENENENEYVHEIENASGSGSGRDDDYEFLQNQEQNDEDDAEELRKIRNVPSNYLNSSTESSSVYYRDVSVQTNALPFGPKTTSEYLLGEVRPWGSLAKTLPKKGLGMRKKGVFSK